MSDRALHYLLIAVFGAYAGALLGPPAAAVGARFDAPLATPVTVAIGAVVGALAVAAVAESKAAGFGDTPPSLRSLRGLLALFAIPAGYGAAFVAAETGVTAAVAPKPALIAGALLGGTAAGVAAFLAGILHTRHVRATATADVRFEARRSPAMRRQHRRAGVVLMLVGGVTQLGVVFTSGQPMGFAYMGLVAAGIALVGGADQTRTFIVTDAGLVVGAVVRPWEAYTAVERDGDAVVLRASGWRGDEQFDRTDIDEERVVAALERRVDGRS